MKLRSCFYAMVALALFPISSHAAENWGQLKLGMSVEQTLAALSNGQVEELVIAANFDAIKYNPKAVEQVLEDYAPGDDNSATVELPESSEKRQIADELIIRALNSAAKIVFIEDESILDEAGGVGAVLRYNQNATANG